MILRVCESGQGGEGGGGGYGGGGGLLAEIQKCNEVLPQRRPAEAGAALEIPAACTKPCSAHRFALYRMLSLNPDESAVVARLGTALEMLHWLDHKRAHTAPHCDHCCAVAATATRSELTDARVHAHGVHHLVHVSARLLAQCGDLVTSAALMGTAG